MQWTLDPNHSGVEFSIRHMGIATVRGRFKRFTASVETDDRGTLRALAARIEAASIDTGVEQRDAHLRSPDFFDVARFPTLEFRSTAIEPRGTGSYGVSGTLTMHGQTHPVTFDVEAPAPITDPWGNQRIAGSANGSLKRTTWGLAWNQALEFGGWLVGEDVRFTIELQAVAGAASPAAAA
jgi:polyisoprenoid-binding protein YceI